MSKHASSIFLLIIIVVKGFEVAAYQEATLRDYPEVKYKGPVVYSDLPPPVLYFPSFGDGSKPSEHDDPGSFLYDPEQVDRSERNVEYVPLPYQDLPVLVYQSNHNPPIHVVNKEKKDDSLSKEFVDWLSRKSETTSRSFGDHKQYDDSDELNSQQHSRHSKGGGSNIHNLSILPDHKEAIKQRNFAEEYKQTPYLTSQYENYRGSGDRLQEYTFPLPTQLEGPLGKRHFENGNIFDHGDLNAQVAQWAYEFGEQEKYALNSNPDEFSLLSQFEKSQNDFDQRQSKQAFEYGGKLSFQQDSNPKDSNSAITDSVEYFVHNSPTFEDSSSSSKGIISSMAPRRYGYFQQHNSQANYNPFQSAISLPETFLFQMNQGLGQSYHSARNPNPRSVTVNLESIYYGNQRVPLNFSASKGPRVQESLLDFPSVVRPVYVSTFSDVGQTNARYPPEETGKVFRGVPSKSGDVDSNSSQQSKQQQGGKFESARDALTVFPVPSHSSDVNQQIFQTFGSSQVKTVTPKDVKIKEKVSDSLSNQHNSQTLPYIVYTGHPPIHVFQHPVVQKDSKQTSEKSKSLSVDAENDESKISIGSSHKAILPNIDNKAIASRIPMQKASGTVDAPNPLQETNGPQSSNKNAEAQNIYPKVQDLIQPVIIPLDFDRFVLDRNLYKGPNLSLRPQYPADISHITQVNSVSPDTLLRRLKLSVAYRGLLNKLASLGNNILVGTLKIQPQYYPQALSALYLSPSLQSSKAPATQNQQSSPKKQYTLGSSEGKLDAPKPRPKAPYKVPTTKATASPRHRKPPIIIYKGLQPPVHVYDSDVNSNKQFEYDQKTHQTNFDTQALSDSSGIGNGPQRVFSVGELSSLFRQPVHEFHSGKFSDSLFLQDYQPFYHHGSDYRPIEKRVEHDPTERASHPTSDSSSLSASSWVPVNFPHYTQAESISDVIVPVMSEEKSTSNGYALDQVGSVDNSESSRDVSKEGSKDSLISKTDISTVNEKVAI